MNSQTAEIFFSPSINFIEIVEVPDPMAVDNINDYISLNEEVLIEGRKIK